MNMQRLFHDSINKGILFFKKLPNHKTVMYMTSV